MSTISAELAGLLKTFDYPAHQSDLVREARREGIGADEILRLANMTPRSYTGRFDVLTELRWDRAKSAVSRRLHPVLA